MPKISQEKWDENSARLVEIASELFYKYGYNNTSVNDIVKEAGISKGGFYTYFDSKESLFLAIINKEDQKIIHSGRDLSVTEDTKMLMGHYISYRLKRFLIEENKIRAKYTVEFWSSTNLNDEQKNRYDTQFLEFKNDIFSIVKIGQSKKIFKLTISLEAFTYVLLSTIDGIIWMDAVLGQPMNDEIINTTIEIFTNYLLM